MVSYSLRHIVHLDNLIVLALDADAVRWCAYLLLPCYAPPSAIDERDPSLLATEHLATSGAAAYSKLQEKYAKLSLDERACVTARRERNRGHAHTSA